MAALPGRIFKIGNIWFKDVTRETASGGIFSYREAWHYAYGISISEGSFNKKAEKKKKEN